MKRLKKSLTLTLIGLVLFLSAADPSPRELAVHPPESAFQRQRGGYGYYGPANVGSSTENQGKTQPATDITKNAANAETGMKRADWLTAFTGVLALVAFFQLLTLIAQSLATYWTYEATRSNAKATFRSALAAMRSARVAKLALQSDRPYLLIEEVMMKGVSPPPAKSGLANLTDAGTERDPISMTFKFRNFGKGPALIREVVSSVTRREDWPEANNFSQCEKQSIAKEAIAAGEAYEHIVISSLQEGFFLTHPEFEAMEKGNLKLIGYGRLDYRDVFDVPYWTEFCWSFLPWSGIARIFATGSGEWRGHGQLQRGPKDNNGHK